MTADERILAELGYKQEFKREFSTFSTAAFCFSIMGVLASFSSTLIYPLSYGGHVGMVWGWFTASCFVMCVALSLAELCSAMPTSGGVYFWSARLAPPEYAPLASWLTGWCNLIGQVALVCSIDYTCADMISDAVSVGSDFTTFYSTELRYCIFLALLVGHGLLCSSPTRVTAKLNVMYVFINLAGVLATIVCLAALGTKVPGSVAFGEFQNNSTYSSNGFAWLLSMTAAMWSLTGYDCASHIAEETSNASKSGAIAIISAVAGTAGFGWILSIVTSFVIDDPSKVLESPLSLPAAQVFYDVLGKRGMLALWSVIAWVQFNTAATQTTDASRVFYAFARDGALPFSGFISSVNRFTQTPVNATWVTVVCSAILGLLTLQSTAGLALFSTAVIGLYVSYVIPVAFRISSYGRRHFRPGAWHMGKASVYVGSVACLWVAFIVVILLFPANPGPSPQDMNWSVLILGLILLSSYAWWFFSAHKWYKGPIGNLSAHNPVEPTEETRSVQASPVAANTFVHAETKAAEKASQEEAESKYSVTLEPYHA
ncbi:amino acid transporter [Violaceomyces palustris]|uniref:Amino acid transporter n=1 Tax=Violaceomyces palustris TaxID=1673888 RepID=A0ACD0NTK7_9BASI|nr:amino acid transporter [Violaceomyces palustris]